MLDLMSDLKTSYDLTDRQLAGRVWLRLHPYRKRLVWALTLLVLAVPFINFHPLVWGFVADALIEQTLTPVILGWWLAAMIGAYLIGLGANAIQSFLLEKTGQAFVRDIRGELFAKFQAQSLGYHRDRSTGELVTRITGDVDAMEQSVLQGLTSLLEEIVTFIVVAGMVIWISPMVGLASIIPLAFAFIFIRKYNRRVKQVYAGIRKKLGHIGAFVQDRLAGILVTKSFGREKSESASFQKSADGFYHSSVKASRLRNTYFPVVSLFGFANNVIMLGLGAWLIMSGSSAFTIGALLAYRGFWWRLQSPIRTIAQTSDILQRARAAATRIMEILDEPVAIKNEDKARPLEQVNGAITFSDVSFSYVPEKLILDRLDFSVRAGEFVAIAGGSGSGKSTLLNLIPRFYDLKSGSIRIDDTELWEITLADLRRQVGYVGQDHHLFEGTVHENLRYGRPEAGDEDCFAAAQKANAHDFILSLPKGYQTQVGQNGVKLSGGQRQRLNLARAFLVSPRILLLDEPTASVEPESESLIHEAILNRTNDGKGTTLLVTHRVDLLKKAPRILFLDQGKIAADGRHQDLVRDCPTYAEAYQRWELEEAVLIES
ncbi:MAG: ABC transporter ATP-binding protein [Akkermansiaceae bacterium]